MQVERTKGYLAEVVFDDGDEILRMDERVFDTREEGRAWVKAALASGDYNQHVNRGCVFDAERHDHGAEIDGEWVHDYVWDATLNATFDYIDAEA